jgi:hypothetical protein
MKFINLFSLLGFLILASCAKERCTQVNRYQTQEPVFLSESEFRGASIKSKEPIQLEQAGKMAFYKNYIFVNDLDKGILVIDNSSPTSPKPIRYYEIMGNKDITIKNNVLYADSYIDLLVIDISNIESPNLVSREKNTFKGSYGYTDSQNRLFVGYKTVWKTETIDCNENNLTSTLGGRNPGPSFTGSSSNNGNTAQVGSMARFALVNNYLYTVIGLNLNAYNVSDARNPSLTSTQQVGWNIETIYPSGDNLFIGSSSGMYIFDWKSSPERPSAMGQFRHADACDPVVVEGNKAYVTLRSGTACNGFTNQMDIVDITNLQAPSLIKTVPFTNPHGLAISNNTVYLCDGPDGLKIMDVSDPFLVSDRQLYASEKFNSFDPILLENNVLLVVGPKELRQYNVTDKRNPVLLSKFAL